MNAVGLSRRRVDARHAPFGEYRTIRFTFSSTQGGYVYFGDHLESAYVYTDAAADAGKTVIVEVGVDDGVAYVSIDGRRSEYPDWTQHDLNALPFRVFDKNIADREVFAHTGERYTYKIGNPTVEYNYLQEADTILAGLPAAADVYNAEQIHADILALEQIRDQSFFGCRKDGVRRGIRRSRRVETGRGENHGGPSCYCRADGGGAARF